MPTRNSDDIAHGRTRRALKVGTLTTSVGGSYLWQTLKRPFQSASRTQRGLLEAHIRNALRIVESSQELKGAFMKLVQMLSMRADLFPAEALEVLSVVQSAVPPMSYDVIRRQIRSELGGDPEELFDAFAPEAFAAASLGQVHRARLRSGEDVVVKVQYPGVEQTVDQDLRNMKALLHVLTLIARDVMRQRVDPGDVYRELEERLQEELDYSNEAANIRRFQEMLGYDPDIVIPAVYPACSSRRVLTMGFVEGYRFQEIAAPGVEQSLKDWVAVTYFRTVWRQVFEFGVLHTDPHPGNYLVTFHPRLAILDFGSIRIFPPEIRAAYLALARALLADAPAAATAACLTLGFLDARDPPSPLYRILRILLEPVLVDRPFDPQTYRSLERAVEVATIGLEHRLFKAPGHRVFLMRALVGLDAHVKQFGTVTNWHRIFAEQVERATEREGRATTAKPGVGPRTGSSR